MCKAWEGFTTGAWQSRIDVRDFIQKNYTPYGGDEAFLAPATPRTQALMHKLQGLMKLEQEFGGVLDVDTQTVSSLLNYKPGYLDKDNELIVGLQTDRPLKRGVNPFGGIRMARQACLGYPDSDILRRAGGDPEKINAKIVIDAAKAGDPTAMRVFDRYAKYLAITINNVTAFLDPEMIVLGGGVSHAGKFLLDAVCAQLPRYLMYKTLPSPRIELAKLGNEAGIIGAALLGKSA